jgi:hypothetical protein
MPETRLSEAMPAVDPEDEERHGCCCEHVAEEIEAIPAPEEEIYATARDRYYACPHHELTPLELWMEMHWAWRSR